MKKLLAVGLLVTLAACAEAVVPPVGRPPLPPELTAPCPDLTPLQDGTGAAVLNKLVEVGNLYRDCQARHAALSEAVQ